MTDLLLISPHQPRTAEILRTATGITQPLGIGYIAAYAGKKGYSVEILDNDIEQLSDEEFKNRIREIKPLCAGLSVCTSSVNTSFHLARLIKEVDGKIKVFMGGVHPTILPELILKNENVDMAVIGEGEETVTEILSALKAGKSFSGIRGLACRNEAGETVFNGERELIENLDSLPFPAYELMPMGKYTLPASRRMTAFNVASLVTGRGCPYSCRFCSHNTVFRGRVRFRSPENVVDEMLHLRGKFGVGEFLFWDDSILLNRARALRLFGLIKKELPGIIWSASSRVDHLDEEMAEAMKTAGCRMLLFGVESGSQKILDSINKKTNLEQIRKAAGICKKTGILSFCSFIIGTPEETEETVAETKKFVLRLDPDYAIFCVFAPMPGSQYFRELFEKGLLDPERMDWDDYINLLSSRPPARTACKLSRERLVEAQKDLFRSFYLRPSYIMKRFLMMRSPEHLRQNIRGALAVIKLQFNRFKK